MRQQPAPHVKVDQVLSGVPKRTSSPESSGADQHGCWLTKWIRTEAYSAMNSISPRYRPGHTMKASSCDHHVSIGRYDVALGCHHSDRRSPHLKGLDLLFQTGGVKKVVPAYELYELSRGERAGAIPIAGGSQVRLITE
jgi:hypothetical protein